MMMVDRLPQDEMQSRAGLTFPKLTDTIRSLSRAFTLRCPHCGGFGILKSWFSLKEACPKCGMRLERGEGEDYFLGGMMFNLIFAEGIFAIAFVTALIVMWPDVPWDGLEYILGGAMLILPILLYPLSRVVWLACDLLVRPMTPEEMAWHHASQAQEKP